MKKITNKIFWITAVAAILIVILGITIPFQVYFHNNPPQPQPCNAGYILCPFCRPQIVRSQSYNSGFQLDTIDSLESITEIEEDTIK